MPSMKVYADAKELLRTGQIAEVPFVKVYTVPSGSNPTAYRVVVDEDLTAWCRCTFGREAGPQGAGPSERNCKHAVAARMMKRLDDASRQ